MAKKKKVKKVSKEIRELFSDVVEYRELGVSLALVEVNLEKEDGKRFFKNESTVKLLRLERDEIVEKMGVIEDRYEYVDRSHSGWMDSINRYYSGLLHGWPGLHYTDKREIKWKKWSK